MAPSGWEGVIGQKDQGVQTTRLKINKKQEFVFNTIQTMYE